MKKSILFNWLLLLSAYLPFEDFILKWLPVSEINFLVLRQIPDAIVLCLLILVFFVSLAEKRFPLAVDRRTFFIFIIFISYACLTIYINQSSIFDGLLNFKALIRYIFLINILYFCRPTERQIRFFIRLVILLAFVEAIIGFAQTFGGDSVREFFKPRVLKEELYMVFTALTAVSDPFGTMAYTINYASFLVIGLILFISFGRQLSYRKSTMYVGITFLLSAIYLSNSRTAFIAAIIAVILHYLFTAGRTNSAYAKIYSFLIVFFIVAFLFFEKGTSNEDFWFFLSPDFYTMLESQRFGMIQVFHNFVGSVHSLFGLSPDKSFIVHFIVRNYKLPPLLAETTLDSIEDVYWIALIFYYGFIGLILLSLFLSQIYKKLRALEIYIYAANMSRAMILSSKILIVLLIPMNFLNQSFEVRHFSFYLWMIIGLALLHARRLNSIEQHSI